MSNTLNKDENTHQDPTAIACGKRMFYVRKITGMTMEVFGKISGLSRTSINYWEKGKKLLTTKSAKKIVQALWGEGIRCSESWLLYGIGEAPRIVCQEKLSKLSYQSSETIEIQPLGEIILDYKDSDLEKEIELFKRSHPEHLVCQIKDNLMQPLYRKDDWVGGIKLPKSTMDLSHRMDCIVSLEQKTLIARRVKIEEIEPLKLSFYGINPEVSIDYPPLRYIYYANIVALAPIIRVWRGTVSTNCKGNVLLGDRDK
jgi:transcriptional regulator with XRE-family HTH domain